MLKRLLKFFGFATLVVIVVVEARELFLSYFVFFPMLLIPALFFLEDSNPNLFRASVAVIIAVYVSFSWRHRFTEILLLGILQISLLISVIFFRKYWAKKISEDAKQANAALANLEALKQKHQSRLESLHHLEKQVAGLLDLFEIARDFNDCLSFEGIAAILFERVRPELPFSQMLLALLDSKESAKPTVSRIFFINERGVSQTPSLESLSYRQGKQIEIIRETRKFFQEDRDLAFPVLVDGEICAYLLIENINLDDLAKFEVLAAYLALQVKKVRLYEAVRELSIKDGLTGVFVRRHFMERFDEELHRSLKYELPLAVLMLDIDHFKRYNDTYGHLAGDATLKQVANLLIENLRRLDIVARYGGEEFVIVTPETRKAEALEVAERIRSNIARHNFKIYNDQARVTVSIGVSIFPADIPDSMPKMDHAAMVVELIHRADQALYRAKEEGRNRVIAYQEL